jgi:cobalamin-dependent methionine synthase I
MAIPGLTVIGETINDSIPSTHALFEANDLDGILALATSQAAGGAAAVDVNVGRRAPAFMADLVRRIQAAVARPLVIDTPDPAIARAGLEAYDPARAGGAMPILNSISPLRMQMLDLYAVRPFRPILLITERSEGGQFQPNRTAEETYRTAKEMLRAVRASRFRIPNDQLIFDPGISPAACDLESMNRRLWDAMGLIHDDPELRGVHMSVGLSNFTHMLPSKRPDGSPVRSALESAFITKAMPRGLDTIIGSVKRNYALLPPDHPAMACLDDVLRMDSFEAIERVRQFYTT